MLQRLFIRIDWVNTSNDRHNHYQQNKHQFRFIYHFTILFYTISKDKDKSFFYRFDNIQLLFTKRRHPILISE